MPDVAAVKAAVARAVDELRPALEQTSLAIHADPEVAYEERRAAERLATLAASCGATVRRAIGGVETAFAAELHGAAASPLIALCAEYDALPGIGHACGHNLMGTASVGAFLALHAAEAKLPATVRLIGTPAEERGNGKVRLIEAGMFRDVDGAMMFHAGTADELDPLMLAMVSLEVEFAGKAAHAAARPYLGVNALDAMVMAYNNVSALRQVIRSDSRVHGIITHGGDAPNIIPARAAGRFMVRSPDNRYLEQLKAKAQRCFEGAALATGAEVRLRFIDQCDALTTNEPLAEAFAANAAALGRPLHRRTPNDSHGSTDMGNVSTLVPSIHPYLAIAPEGTPTHSVEFARYAGSPAAQETMVVAAKALALTAVDLAASPELVRRVKQAHAAHA